jgi:penicillin-binding protein 1A
MKYIFKVIYLIITFIILFILLIGSIAGLVVFYSISNASLVLKEGYKPIEIYDDKNNLISTNSIYYNYVSITDISQNIINAYVAVEDRNFFNHIGISPKRILGSIYNNIFNDKFEGASTITQQYVKNAFLTNEQTIKRKVNEMAIAISLEKKYTKLQIMEAYLNSILYGGNIYGIDMACKYYFNKNPKDININEAAYLAGLIQAPNRYNAFKNLSLADERKNVVLDCMYDCGYITNKEYTKYKNESISLYLSKGVDTNRYSYLNPYLDYLYSNIDQNTHINKIYTYLDTTIQKELANIVENKYDLFPNDDLNCAIVVLDNHTYGIKALVGNRNLSLKVLNYATDIRLQPGSTIKPILDYAPAIEYLSLTLSTVIDDEPYTYSDGTPIKNYDNNYLGPITLRYALKDSRNVPAVKLFNMVGHQRAFKFANKLGIYSDSIHEADSIGGATYGYYLLDIANAYQAFANLGYYKKASQVKQINYDDNIYYNDSKPTLVMKPTTAFLINSCLHDIFKGSAFDLEKTYLMAKTGQTNYDKKTREKYNIPASATKDSLLVAYTKDITIAVWVGYEEVKESRYLDRKTKNIPRSIMKYIMQQFADNGSKYNIIDGITTRYITILNNEAYLATNNGFLEYYEEGTEPLTKASDKHAT